MASSLLPLPALPGLPALLPLPGFLGRAHGDGTPFDPRPALPGDLAEVTTRVDWARWDLHPSVLLGVLALALAYAWVTGPLRRREGLGPPPERWRLACYASSLAVLLLSLQGPIHHLSDDYLFTAHMVQHLLLTQVFPPLFLLGLPGWAVTRVLRPPALLRLGRAATRPLTIFLLYNAVVTFWHVPVTYEWAMRDHDVHIAEHLMFLFAAVPAWWPAVGASPALPRPSYPIQVLYLFGMTAVMKITGAVISLQAEVIYPFYAQAPRVFPLSAYGDQRLGGLLMWVLGDSVLWLVMGVVFWRWAIRDRAGEARDGSMERGPLPLPG